MRQLAIQEIKQLESQGCSAQDWSSILVHEQFQTSDVRHTTFSGHVEIGAGVLLDHVGMIENYRIGNNTHICRVNELVATHSWPDKFYEEGITVGNEAGGINIHFKPYHNEKLDWIEAHYPTYVVHTHNNAINGLHTYNEVGEGCSIRNSGTIRNVHLKEGVSIDGAAHLEEGELHNECLVGPQVIARKFSIGPHSQVTDGAKLYHVITTRSCKIGKGFMAENCYFGHHSELFCGEACAIFAGPHTVSHHKSTLLIGGEFSFYNAGSNTNQSNHAYKLGPLHHGVLARGSKTASGSHILWPMQTAAFTMVMGKIKSHPSLTDLPFSYVIAEGEKVYVAPGVNIGTSGTFRDILKWRRRGSDEYSYLGEYEFLSPLIIQQIIKGIDVLNRLEKEQGSDTEEYLYNGAIIRRRALVKGRKRYLLALRLYAYKIVPSNEILEEAYEWQWTDVAGLPVVEECLEEVCQLLGASNTPEKCKEAIRQLDVLYTTKARQWGNAILTKMWGESFTCGKIQKEALQAIEEWKDLLKADAEKEILMGDVAPEVFAHFCQDMELTCLEAL